MKNLFDQGVEYQPSLVERLEDDFEKEIKRYRRSYITQTIRNRIPFVNQLLKRRNRRTDKDELTEGVKYIIDYDALFEKISHNDFSVHKLARVIYQELMF